MINADQENKVRRLCDLEVSHLAGLSLSLLALGLSEEKKYKLLMIRLT